MLEKQSEPRVVINESKGCMGAALNIQSALFTICLIVFLTDINGFFSNRNPLPGIVFFIAPVFGLWQIIWVHFTLSRLGRFFDNVSNHLPSATFSCAA
ncbi:MAG: hypothetical protein AAF741_14305 [Bacteroidota bacterium]